MQEEARCEQQSNGAWRVSLHPSGREVAVYSDELQALDVTELINLKIKIDAKLPKEGLTDDLDAEQIELVINMPMEELLQKVVPVEVKLEPSTGTKAAEKIEDQYTADIKEEDEEGSQGQDDDSSSGDEDDAKPAAVGHQHTRPGPWQKNADGSFSKEMGKGYFRDGRTVHSWSLNDEIRNSFIGENNKNVVFIYRDGPTGEQKDFNVALRSTIHNKDVKVRQCRNTLSKGRRLLYSALSLRKGDVITLSKGPVMGQIYIDVDRRNVSTKRQYRVPSVSSSDSEEDPLEQQETSVKCATTEEIDEEEDSKLEEDGNNAGVNVSNTGRPLRRHYWQRNSDGSYSKVLPARLRSISVSQAIIIETFRSISNDLVLITKSSQPELNNRRFECQYNVNSSVCSQLSKGIANLLGFLKAKQGDTITLFKGPAAGQAFISTEVQGVPCHEVPINGWKQSHWIKNSDGSYSKLLPPIYKRNKGRICTGPEIRRELIRHQYRDFILIIKSADPDLDGKRFPVKFGTAKGKSCLNLMWRGFGDVASCLNLQPYDIITLSKGPNIGEVYLSVTKVKQPKQQPQHHNTALLAAAESQSGGVQKRQLPSPSSDLQDTSPAAKRHRTSMEPSSTPSLGQQELQQSVTAPEPVQVVQGAAERRSLPEMLVLVKRIIEKDAVGLTAAEMLSYRTMFMIKMTPQAQVSSLQMLEELDGAGEHDGVKLCVQMSLHDLK